MCLVARSTVLAGLFFSACLQVAGGGGGGGGGLGACPSTQNFSLQCIEATCLLAGQVVLFFFASYGPVLPRSMPSWGRGFLFQDIQM